MATGRMRFPEHSQEQAHAPEYTAEQLIRDREHRAHFLSTFCSVYEATTPDGSPPDAEIRARMRTTFDLADTETVVAPCIAFVVDALRGKLRQDHSPLAAHSLELFLKARAFGIDDLDVHATALLHDVGEDSDTRTFADIERLGMELGRPQLSAFVRTMTEDRTSGNRDHDLVQFTNQLRAATGVPENQRHVVVLTELLDRIDDLSSATYLTAQLDIPERASDARVAIIGKLAKCGYTIDRVAAGIAHPDARRLRRAFETLAAHHRETLGISDRMIATAQRDRYERWEVPH